MGPGNTPYCTPSDLSQYAPAQVLSLATSQNLTDACNSATETADSYLRGRYALPLLSWGNDVRRMTAYVAVYLLMSGAVGFAPQAGADSNVTINYYTAVGYPDRPGSGWFPGIQRQNVHPDVTPSATPGQDPGHDVPQVFTSPQRGWTCRTGPQRVG